MADVLDYAEPVPPRRIANLLHLGLGAVLFVDATRLDSLSRPSRQAR